MKRLAYAIIFIVLVALASCTENVRVKTLGGVAILNLKKGQKLVNVTWKDANLWVLTTPMKRADSAQTYTFTENSSYGLMEGSYIIVESK